MQSKAKTVEQYLKELPANKREIIEKVRLNIIEALPEGIEEAMNYGMICYQIPIEYYPDTYNKKPLMFAALAAQKNHFAIYLTNIYMIPELERELLEEYKKRGLKPDIGKSCIRFKRLDQIPLDKIRELINCLNVDEFIEYYEKIKKKK